MHDPKTVAFEIYLGKKQKKNGQYRSPLITIWHNDPEKNVLGCKSDDSCGWFSPPYTQNDYEKVKKLASEQYSNIFAKQEAERENKSYSYICYNQDTYGAIYWSWRALRSMDKKGWQYGNGLLLSPKELDKIYVLATNPVDNFQHVVNNITNKEQFIDFFILVWRSYRSFYRKWYQHPRWHIYHWSIQFHPLQKIKRRYWDKCCICGERGFKGGAFSNWDGDKMWHEECNGFATSIVKANTN